MPVPWVGFYVFFFFLNYTDDVSPICANDVSPICYPFLWLELFLVARKSMLIKSFSSPQFFSGNSFSPLSLDLGIEKQNKWSLRAKQKSKTRIDQIQNKIKIEGLKYNFTCLWNGKSYETLLISISISVSILFILFLTTT
jgi:hypothetical protein